MTIDSMTIARQDIHTLSKGRYIDTVASYIHCLVAIYSGILKDSDDLISVGEVIIIHMLKL